MAGACSCGMPLDRRGPWLVCPVCDTRPDPTPPDRRLATAHLLGQIHWPTTPWSRPQ